MYNVKTKCSCCLSEKIFRFIDFGEVPLAGSYVKQIEETVLFPLSLSVCENCFHVQVNEYIDKEYLFKDYRYLSNYSMKPHFSEFANAIKERFGSSSRILEIGSNDGTFIELLEQQGNDVTGIEPSLNVAQVSINKGHKVINDFFSKETLINANINKGSADIISASNCFAHIEDIDKILDGVNYALSENGTFIIEVHYGPNLFETLQYDFIYHEHMYYYSLSSINALLGRNGLHIYDVEFISTHGGSIRVFSSKEKKEERNFVEYLNKEKTKGFHELSTYKEFNNRVAGHIADAKDFLHQLKKEGKRIIGYGAAGRANAFLNYANINNEIIDFIIDESPERYGRIIPKQNIPIRSLKDSLNEHFNVLFITAWNFFEAITAKTKEMDYSDNLVVFPTIKMSEK